MTNIERLAYKSGLGARIEANGDYSGDMEKLAKFAALVADDCAQQMRSTAKLIPPNGEAHMLQREALFDGSEIIRAKYPKKSATGARGGPSGS